MTALANEVQGIVAYKLKAIGMDVPIGIEMPVAEVGQAILNYCNICRVPHALRFTWANMVLDYLRWEAELLRVNDSDPDSPGGSATATITSSIRQGDTSVGFSADTSSQTYQSAKAHNIGSGDGGILDKFVMNYADQLNKFRRVCW